MTAEELGISRITPSMLVEYENCPRLFYYRSWLGLQIPVSKIHLFFGTAIHAAIDEIYNQKDVWGNDQCDFNKVVQIFKDTFKEGHVDDKDYTLEARAIKYNEMIVDGIAMLEAFWKEKEILWSKGVQPIRMELPIKMQVFNPKTKEPLPIMMSGRFDGECESGDISEFKTSGKIYDVFATRASHQARCYSWLQYCRTGLLKTIHYVVLIKNRKKDRIQHLDFYYDEADLIAYDTEVRSILERIKKREFQRPVRGHPPYCDCHKYEKLLTKIQ